MVGKRLVQFFGLDSNPPALVNTPQISTRLSCIHSLIEHLQTIKSLLNCFASAKTTAKTLQLHNATSIAFAPAGRCTYVTHKDNAFQTLYGCWKPYPLSTTLSFTIYITIKRYSYSAWLSLLLGHTSVLLRFAAHTNILLSQTVIVMCAIRAVRSVRYNVMISYKFSNHTPIVGRVVLVSIFQRACW